MNISRSVKTDKNICLADDQFSSFMPKIDLQNMSQYPCIMTDSKAILQLTIISL